MEWKHCLPERWDTQQNAKRRFRIESTADVLDAWTEPVEWQTMFFYRKSAPESELYVGIKRYRHARFNEFTAYVRDGYFGATVEVGELLRFASRVAAVINPNHGFISHKRAEVRQSPSLTISERLPGIYWANFFGAPYIDFFGREKLLRTPCYDVREVGRDLILLLTAESPFGREILLDDEIANGVKDYLGNSAFAGPNFPEQGCLTPTFDFSDVRLGFESDANESVAEQIIRIRSELENSGYELEASTDSKLTFRGRDGSHVSVDVATGSVTLDVSNR
jgi:hypothetical protein